MNDSDLPKSEHRWHQFSLRTLLVTVLFGVALSWFGIRVWARDSILATLESLGPRAAWVGTVFISCVNVVAYLVFFFGIASVWSRVEQHFQKGTRADKALGIIELLTGVLLFLGSFASFPFLAKVGFPVVVLALMWGFVSIVAASCV